jgi:hypothetical protein
MKNLNFFGVLLVMLAVNVTVNAQSLTKVYNAYGVSMKYASNMEVVEEEYEDGQFMLTLSNEDDGLAVMVLMVIQDDEMSEMFKLLNLEGLFDLMKESMVEELGDNVTFGAVQKQDSNNCSQTFTASEDGEKFYGEVMMSVRGDKFILSVIGSKEKSDLNTLKASYNSLKV